MKIRRKLNLSFIKDFYGKIVPGLKTEIALAKKFEYPNFATTLDNFILFLENKYGISPKYDVLTLFITYLEHRIIPECDDVSKYLLSIKVVDINENFEATVEIEYED